MADRASVLAGCPILRVFFCEGWGFFLAIILIPERSLGFAAGFVFVGRGFSREINHIQNHISFRALYLPEVFVLTNH